MFLINTKRVNTYTDILFPTIYLDDRVSYSTSIISNLPIKVKGGLSSR